MHPHRPTDYFPIFSIRASELHKNSRSTEFQVMNLQTVRSGGPIFALQRARNIDALLQYRIQAIYVGVYVGAIFSQRTDSEHYCSWMQKEKERRWQHFCKINTEAKSFFKYFDLAWLSSLLPASLVGEEKNGFDPFLYYSLKMKILIKRFRFISGQLERHFVCKRNEKICVIINGHLYKPFHVEIGRSFSPLQFLSWAQQPAIEIQSS